jgi:hypothetical protein
MILSPLPQIPPFFLFLFNASFLLLLLLHR